MIDIKFVRNYPEKFDDMMLNRGLKHCSKQILSLDQHKRKCTSDLHALQQEKNLIAQQVAQLKNNSAIYKDDLIAKSKGITQKLQQKKSELEQNKLDELLSTIPNMLSDKTPIGKNEDANVLVKEWGTIPVLDFTPKHHYELGVMRDLLDFEKTASVSGSRFCTIKSNLAKLERALIDFMLEQHTQHYGFTEFSVPYLVKANSMYNTGQLPKFENDAFKTEDGYYLIPTGEVPILNMFQDTIIGDLDKPIRFTGHTQCFRREAGSTGKDTRGIIRQHQFSKVEMISIAKPEDSYKELDYITYVAESLLQKLALPYRVVSLCSGDIGFSATLTYDIEVWFPAQNLYREISSCSNCESFQSRRAKIRYKTKTENKLAHTLNGSGLAVGRTLAAIMENYQNADGSITIPSVLKCYFKSDEI